MHSLFHQPSFVSEYTWPYQYFRLYVTLFFLNLFTSKRAQNACINKLHVTSRPIIFWGYQGAVKNRKTPYFWRFWGIFAYNFTLKKRAQNACINKLHVTSRPIICWGVSGGRQNSKNPLFLTFLRVFRLQHWCFSTDLLQKWRKMRVLTSCM